MTTTSCRLLLTCLVSLLPAAVACGQPDTSPHQVGTFDVDGVELHYLDWGGSGEPLVFLTGYGAQAHVFDRLATHFTDRFRVVALTRRGQEPPGRPAGGYDHATLTGDVAALMDTLGFERAHLAAHSFGGAEATRLATTFPERVLSIVYLDAALNPAVGEAVRAEAPVPNPVPPPGSPYAQVLEWWTAYTPDFTAVDCPSLAFFAV